MTQYTAWCIYNIAVLALIGVAIHVTGSLWSFLGIIALASYKSKEDN